MLRQKIILFLRKLEDSRNPLLGPNIMVLYLFGIWHTAETKLRNKLYNIIHVSTMVYVLAQIIDLCLQFNDFNKALNNLSMTTLSLICCAKCFSFVLRQSEWQELGANISNEELSEMMKKDKLITKKMKEYTFYARVITYLFWILVLMTNLTLIASPMMKFFTSASYRKDIREGREEYPQIMSCWFPFDDKKMPGYLFACIIHISMSFQGAGVLAGHDANAIAVMTFMKGQMQLLRDKCIVMFETREDEGPAEFLKRIRECHRHHSFLIRQSELFDSLLSPVMFIYVLLCSMGICCSVIQFSSSEATAAQRLWAVQYTTAQISQLFFFCWHANEVFVESTNADQGVFESDWWKADVRLRRHVILLAGKLNRPILYSAGPFSKLTVPTFISIIKGSYSFYTLFSQMQEVN